MKNSIISLVLMAWFSALSAQNFYYVNDNSTAGDRFTSAVGNTANNGLTPATPKASLSQIWLAYGPTGSNTLAAGDTILIDAGTYTTDISLTINVPGITFKGAGATFTVFDNQMAGASTNFFLYIIANDITLMDMTVTGYENNGTQAPGRSGQAITIGGGLPVSLILIQNVNFSGNGASGGNPAISVLANSNVILRGGGSFCNTPGTQFSGGVEVFGDFVNLLIEDYVLAFNEKSAFDGGGLRIEGGANTFVGVKNSRLASNLATSGGAISQINGNLYVQDCIIEDNTAGQISTTVYGGAYRVVAGTSQFSRCLFLTNNAHAGTLRGGAVSCRYASSPGTGVFSTNRTISVILDSCLFAGNAPATNGRDIYAANGFGNSCTVLARDCQFLTSGNFNIVSDAGSPATSVSVTYHGSAPTASGSGVTILPSLNAIFQPQPVVPGFTGSCGNLVLPSAGLSGFDISCEQHHASLSWTSTSESGVLGYSVQRSIGGMGLEEVAWIPKAAADEFVYYWRDPQTVPSGSVYGLSRVLQNGRSEVLTLAYGPESCSDGNAMSVSWAESELGLHFNQPLQGAHLISVLDMQGRLVASIPVQFVEGSTRHSISLPGLTNGVYALMITGTQTTLCSRFVKQ